jgi:hypothetical protein
MFQVPVVIVPVTTKFVDEIAALITKPEVTAVISLVAYSVYSVFVPSVTTMTDPARHADVVEFCA